MSEETRLDAQIISQVVELGLSTQLEDADAISVEVDTNLVKVVQGQIDSVSVSGRGMVIQEDIRLEAAEIQTHNVSLNPLYALFGRLQLDHPIATTGRICLTEVDINRAMRSDTIQRHLPPLSLTVEGTSVTIELLPGMEVKLPAAGKICLKGEVLLREPRSYNPQEARQVGFLATVLPRTNERPVRLEAFEASPGSELSLELITALMQKLKQLLALPYLEWEGIQFRVRQLQVEPGQLFIETEAYLHQVPSL